MAQKEQSEDIMEEEDLDLEMSVSKAHSKKQDEDLYGDDIPEPEEILVNPNAPKRFMTRKATLKWLNEDY